MSFYSYFPNYMIHIFSKSFQFLFFFLSILLLLELLKYLELALVEKLIKNFNFFFELYVVIHLK